MRNVIRLTARPVSYLALALTLDAVTAMPVQAHENRWLNNHYAIAVGFHVEPPIANEANGLDVFAGFDTSGTRTSDPPDFTILDRQAGDTVVLTAVGLRLATDNFNAQILELIPMLKPFHREIIEGDVGYVQDLSPHQLNQTGAYGFIVSGFIKKQGVPPGKLFAQKFVCENGSQDPNGPIPPPEGNGSSFECVKQ